MLRGCFFLSLLSSVLSLYSENSPVKLLNADKFGKMKKSKTPTLVEFFASWCGHCKQLAPEYEKAAKALEGIASLVAVDDEALISQNGVQGFPTIKFFGDDKSSPEEFNGPRSAQGIVDFVLKKVGSIAQARLGGSGSSGSGSKPKQGEPVQLTSGNFNKLVINDDKAIWFIKFYAPWCGHCKNLEPTWNEFAGEMEGKVKVGRVDATEETNLASQYNINSYPTILIFPVGEKSPESAIPCQNRDLDSLKQEAMTYYAATIEAAQLISDEQYQETCISRLCVIAFIPHILDTQAAGRQKYLNDFNTAIRGARGVAAEFLWSQGGDQFEFEEKLNLSFGYPALVAINMKREVFGVHRGTFTQESIRGFLLSLGGRIRLDTLPKNLSPIVKTEKWDGKDAKPIEEEEL